jgi:hypothetical protein
VPEASVEDVIDIAFAPITIDVGDDLLCAGTPLSVTATVKLDVPFAVGVPEITPVAGASVSPAGRLPEAIDHV